MKKADRSTEIRAEINYWLTRNGYSKTELAGKLGMSLASLYNKMRDSSKFTYPEIVQLFSILKLTDERQLQLLR